MFETYFKNKKIVGFQKDGKGGIPKDYDEVVTNLKEEDITKLYQGGTYDGKKVIEKTFTDEELKEKKKIECREKIESVYKEHDQINVLMSGTNTEKTTMKTYINACLDEYRNNGKDAIFSNITKTKND